MYTLSWHQEGEKNANQAHNRREPQAIGKSSCIDTTLTKNNIILIDVPVREAYHRLFDDFVAEYNARARASRKIDDYYIHLGKSAVGKDGRGKQRVYEAIVQLGSKAEGSPEKAVQAFKRYVAGWKKRNPNMVIIGAYIHLDEPNGTPHIHIDYIPVAQCNRGMKLQNTLTRALQAQGFETVKQGNTLLTAQMQWEQAERDTMRQICVDMGIDLYAQGEGRKRHLTIPEYKQAMDNLKEVQQETAVAEAKALEVEFDCMDAEHRLKVLQKQVKQAVASKQSEQQQIETLQARTGKLQQYINDLQRQIDSIQTQLQAGQQQIKKQNSIISDNSKQISKQEHDLGQYKDLMATLEEIQDWLSHDTYFHTILTNLPRAYADGMPDYLMRRQEEYYHNDIEPLKEYLDTQVEQVNNCIDNIDDIDLDL